jgi:hypothetical protein
VITTPIGRPSPLVRALILVEKPPRERPSALRSVHQFASGLRLADYRIHWPNKKHV